MDRVFVSRDLPGVALDRLREVAEVTVWPDELPPTPDELADAVGDVDGLLSLLTDAVDAELLDRAPKLRVVSNFAVGVDNIDLAQTAARNIVVGNTPGILTEATADLAWALIMATRRRVVEAERAIRDGKWVAWHPTFMMGDSVHGCTLGLIGFGRIAQAVARRARGFDIDVLVHSRTIPLDASSGGPDGSVRFVGLDDLLARSDIVSLHVPLSESTTDLIGARELALMGPSATLINTARGPVVDELALVEALRSGTIASAGLDVVESEPIDIDNDLLTLTNCIVVPHIGSATTATRTAMANLAVDNLLAGLRGDPLPAEVPLP